MREEVIDHYHILLGSAKYTLTHGNKKPPVQHRRFSNL